MVNIVNVNITYKMIYFIYRTNMLKLNKNNKVHTIWKSGHISLNSAHESRFKISELIKKKFLIRDLKNPSAKKANILNNIYYYCVEI